MNIVLPEGATPVTAKAWYLQLVMDFGPGFNPDTDANDYINQYTGEKTFNESQAEQFNKSVEKLFELLNDPYDIGLEVIWSHIFGYNEYA